MLGSLIASCGGAPPSIGPAPPRISAEQCAQYNVLVDSSEALRAVRDCVVLASVTVRSGDAIDWSQLATLQRVTGDLKIGPSIAMSDMTLSGLLRIEGTLLIAGNLGLSGVFVPALQFAKSVMIRDNAALTTLSMPKLVQIAGNFDLVRNGDLAAVLAPDLAVVAGVLSVDNNRQLAFVELAPTFAAKAVALSHCPRLDASAIPGAPAVDRTKHSPDAADQPVRTPEPMPSSDF